MLALDESTREMLRQMRWRKQPDDRRRLGFGLVAALWLHVIFSWVLWHPIRATPDASTAQTTSYDAIDIRFIPRLKSATAPPPVATPAPPVRPRAAAPHPRAVRRSGPASKDAMTVHLPDDTQSADRSPKLVDSTGQVLLPPAASAAAPPPADYVDHRPTDTDNVMQHSTPVKYNATRFDKDWHRVGAIDDALQKAVKATTVKHTIELPRGVRIHCAISLAMLAGGCGGDPPAPPSKKDGDERMSMAPSQPLANDPHAPPPPSLEACIAMYRADKPLAAGCPVDTPNRAVDAEKADAAKAAAAGH